MATDHPTCRAKAQSLPAPKFWRRRGLQRPLSLFKGRPGRTREDARTSANQAATGDVEREGGVVMEKQRFRQTLFRYDRQHQNHRILSMLGGSTGPEARTLPCISARILLVPFLAPRVAGRSAAVVRSGAHEPVAMRAGRGWGALGGVPCVWSAYSQTTPSPSPSRMYR